MSSQRPFYVATASPNVPPPHTMPASAAPSTQQSSSFGKSYISPLARAGNAVTAGTQLNLSTQNGYYSKYAYTELSHIDTSNDSFEKPVKGLIEEMRTVNTDERILRKQAFDRHHWHSTLEFVFLKNQLDNNGNIPQSQTSKHTRSSDTRASTREARTKAVKNASLPVLTTEKLPDISRILDWTASDWVNFRTLEQKAAQRNIDLVKYMYLLPDENPAVGAPPPIPPEAQRLAALTAHGSGDGSLSLGMVLGAAGIGVDWLTQSRGDPRLEARNILQTAATIDPREGNVSWLWRPGAQKHMKYHKIARITLAELVAHTQMHGSGRRRREQAVSDRSSDDRSTDMQMEASRANDTAVKPVAAVPQGRRATGNHRSGRNGNPGGSARGEGGIPGDPDVDEEAQEKQRVATKYMETERWGKRWMSKLRNYEANLSTSVTGRRERELENEREKEREAEREKWLKGAMNGNSGPGDDREINESAAPALPQWQSLYGHGANKALLHAAVSVNQATEKKHDMSTSTGSGAQRRSQWNQGERVTLGLSAPPPLIVPTLRPKTLAPAELVGVRDSELEQQFLLLEDRYGVEDETDPSAGGAGGETAAGGAPASSPVVASSGSNSALLADGSHPESNRKKHIPGLVMPSGTGDGYVPNSKALQMAASRLSLLSVALSGHAMPLPATSSSAPYLRALAAPAQFANTLIQPGAHATPLLQTNHAAPMPSSASAAHSLGDLCARIVTINHSLNNKPVWAALSEAAGAPITGYGDREKATTANLWCQCHDSAATTQLSSTGTISLSTASATHADNHSNTTNSADAYTCATCGGILRLPNAPIAEVPSSVRSAGKAIFPRLVRDQTRLSRAMFRQRLLLAGLDPSLPFFADRLFRCVSPVPAVALEARDYALAVLVTVHNDPLYRALLLHAVLDLDDDGILTLHDLYAGMLLGLAKQFPSDYSMLLHFAMGKLAATTPSLRGAGLVAPQLDIKGLEPTRDAKRADAESPRPPTDSLKGNLGNLSIGLSTIPPADSKAQAESTFSKTSTGTLGTTMSLATAPLVLPPNRADPSILQWGALNTVPLPSPLRSAANASGTGLVMSSSAPSNGAAPHPLGAAVAVGNAAPAAGSHNTTVVVAGGPNSSTNASVQAGHNPQLYGPPNLFAQSVLIPSQGTHLFPHAGSHTNPKPQTAVPTGASERGGLLSGNSPRNPAARNTSAPSGPLSTYASFAAPSPSNASAAAAGGFPAQIASHPTSITASTVADDTPSTCVCAVQSGPLYASALTPFWTAQGPVLMCSRGPVIADYGDINAAEKAAGRDVSWTYTVDECECTHKEKGHGEQQTVGKGVSLGLGMGLGAGASTSTTSKKEKEANVCACDCHRGDTSVHVRLYKPGECSRVPLHVVKQTLRVPVGTIHHSGGLYNGLPSASAAMSASDDPATRVLREALEHDPVKKHEYALFRARCERLLQVPSIRQYTHHIHKSELSADNVIITPMELVDMVSRWDNSDVIRLLQLALLFPDLRNIHGSDPDVIVYAREAAPWDKRF